MRQREGELKKMKRHSHSPATSSLPAVPFISYCQAWQSSCQGVDPTQLTPLASSELVTGRPRAVQEGLLIAASSELPALSPKAGRHSFERSLEASRAGTAHAARVPSQPIRPPLLVRLGDTRIPETDEEGSALESHPVSPVPVSWCFALLLLDAGCTASPLQIESMALSQI